MTQKYGYDPTYTWREDRTHYGIDYAPPATIRLDERYVWAAADGIVIISADNEPVGFPGVVDGYWGRYIEIEHVGGLRTGYAHLARRYREVGNRVQQGDVIGIAGNTGRTTGPHLHFQLLLNNRRVTPLPYMREMP